MYIHIYIYIYIYIYTYIFIYVYIYIHINECKRNDRPVTGTVLRLFTPPPLLCIHSPPVPMHRCVTWMTLRSASRSRPSTCGRRCYASVSTVLSFSGWDEYESLSLSSCWRTTGRVSPGRTGSESQSQGQREAGRICERRYYCASVSTVLSFSGWDEYESLSLSLSLGLTRS